MSFDLERLDRAAIIAALFPDQAIDPGYDGLVSVRCIWPGCAATRHTNGDRTPSGLFSPKTGYYECRATGTKTSGWRDTVSEILGSAAWERYREACFTEPARGGGGSDVEATWRGLDREHRWTDLYRIDPELSARYLRAGRRRSGEVYSDSVIGIFDAAGVLSGIKFRLPPGKRWAHPPKGGHVEDKYVAAYGSRVSGVVFLGDRVRDGTALVVCAGEKDALVAASHLDPALWSPVSGCVGEGPSGPARNWVTAISAVARGREVVIAYDGDRPGQHGAWHLARALDGVAASVRALVLPAPDELPPPKGEDRWDVAAFVLERGREALAALLEQAGPVPASWEPPPPPPGLASGGARPAARAGGAPGKPAGAGPAKSRPQIMVSEAILEMTDEAEGALAAAGRGIYHRGGQLVRVVRLDEELDRISPLPEPTLTELLSDCAAWVKPCKDDELRPVPPPRDVVRALAARAEWQRIPALRAVVHGPVLRPDGTVLTAPGYDPAARLLYCPRAGATWPAVPDRPTREQARSALAQLVDVVADFPFVAASDRSAWLAFVLTLVGRNAIDGPVPMFVIRAVSPGTGKSLLVDVASLIGTDLPHEPPRMSQVRDRDGAEERKLLVTLGCEGEPLAMIDNIEEPLGSDVLAAAITSRRYKGRELGGNSRMLQVLLPVFVGTGNNVVVKGDLARRVVPIDLDARLEHPERRSGFRHPNLLAHVRAHRADLRVAALTILRWYCVEGRPASPIDPFGSFEDWLALVPQALIWLGEADPTAGRARIQEGADPDSEARRLVLELWWAKWGPRELSSLALVAEATEELAAALSILCGRGAATGGTLDVRRLGYALRRMTGRIVAGLRLQSTLRGGMRRWHVERVHDDQGAAPAPVGAHNDALASPGEAPVPETKGQAGAEGLDDPFDGWGADRE